MRDVALTLLMCAGGLTVGARASAQVVVVEEEEAEERIVERGYVQGVGRGIQYGAHLSSPVYVTAMKRPAHAPRRASMPSGPGAGVRARIGWEFPSGLTVELLGGLAFNALDSVVGEVPDRSHVLGQADVGLGARYMFFNETAFVPFVQIGVGGRWFWFQWPTGEEVETGGTIALSGAVGFQIELSPFFGLEAGCLVDYHIGFDAFHDGLLGVTPFLGVTLYVYDETDS